jgi:glycosyltransferase involved in cell wall biosynthesis
VRILEISTLLSEGKGGAESTLLEFHEELKRDGHIVFPVGLGPRNPASREPANFGRILPIENIYWPFDGTARSRTARWIWHVRDISNRKAGNAFEAALLETKPDVILCHNLAGWSLTPLVVARKHRKPVVQVLHDYGLLCVSSSLVHSGRPCGDWNPLCSYRRLIARRACRPVAAVGVSHHVLAEYERFGFFSGTQRFVVYPDVRNTEPEGLRRRPLSGRRPVLGYLGRIVPDKGVRDLLRVSQFLSLDVVVGGDDQTPYARALKNEFPNGVYWRGYVQPAAFFSEIDLLVVPSRWSEPFGRVVKEAAIAGVPMIISNKGGMQEAADAGLTPRLVVDTGNVHELARAIVQLASGHTEASKPGMHLGSTTITEVFRRVQDGLR